MSMKPASPMKNPDNVHETMLWPYSGNDWVRSVEGDVGCGGVERGEHGTDCADGQRLPSTGRNSNPFCG